jgi:molecular chaperone HtpG
VLKEGIAQDQANEAALLPLLRFASTAQADNTSSVSLADYLSRLKAGQERIYYVVAESLEAARAHPAIERLKERGLEVLLLAERIDEWVMGQLEAYEGKRFKDAARGDLELGALASQADKARHDAELKESKGLLKRIKDSLGERVTEVRISDRLKDSPALLVLGEHDLGERLRRMLSAAGQKVPEAKPVLEVNVTHPLVRYLDGVADAAEFGELAQLLCEQAQLAEGDALANPPDFVLRLNRLLVRLAAPKGQSSGA